MIALRAAALLAVAVWVWLVLLRGMFWRTDLRLPSGPAPASWPSVAIVVPARDEAAVLPASLPTLVHQDYPGPVRLILVDDGSTDGTGALAARLGAAGRVPVTVLAPGPPPAGWTGKLWALRAGVAAAGEVDYLLLTDADIAHRTDSLSALVRAATRRAQPEPVFGGGEHAPSSSARARPEPGFDGGGHAPSSSVPAQPESGSGGGEHGPSFPGHRFDLVSQMARLRVDSGWERLVVPAFVYFFALLYPFRWSNRPGARTAAAAGGCSLVRRAALERAGGVAAIRGAVIDDVALARVLKRSGATTFLGLADRVDSVRPYPTLASLWRMVARSAYAQLRHSVLLLAGTVLGLALVFLIPPVTTVAGAVRGDGWLLAAGATAWLLMAASYAPMLRYYRQPVPAALLLPFTATLYLAMTVDSAVQHYRGRGAAWKGRTYPAPR